MLTIDKVQLEMIINNDPARKAIRELEDDAKKLRRQMKTIPEGTDEWNKKFNELKSAEAKIEKLRHEIGLTGLTVKELSNRERELNMIMKNLDPRLPMWKQYKAELEAVKQRKLELIKSTQATHFSITRLADGFNKYFGIITMGIATLAGMVFSFRKIIDSFNDFEKKLDRLSALTGLIGADLNWLGDQAKSMSTEVIEGGVRITQGADMIVDAFTKVGSARPELLKDKEALREVTQEAIILSEAAGSELQPAVEALAMVMNQFNTPASEARRIINTLAAGSKVGAGEIPYLTTAFEKAGTVASDAGISIEELVGIIETLAPRISQPEIAGRSLKGVILDLQTTADDTNPAIVGFAQAIENLGKKNLSTVELTKLFGAENITVAKILLNNTGEMNHYTEAVTGTNVAIEQATINTDNNSARLEQARNRIKLLSIELGERLAPALQFSTSGFSYLLKATLAVIKFFDQYGTAIISATAGIIAYTVAVNASTIVTKIWTTATLLAEKATQLFNFTMKSNPIGLVIGLVTSLVTALGFLATRTQEATDEQKKLNEALEEGNKIIEGSRSLEERAKLLDQMSKSGLERFKSDAEQQLQEIDKLDEKKLLAAQKYQDEVVKLEQTISQTATNEAERKALYQNKYFTAERDKAFSHLQELDQMVKDSNAELLNSYIKLAEEKLKLSGGGSGVMGGTINELKAQLSELQKQRDELSISDTNGLIINAHQIDVLNNLIKAYESLDGAISKMKPKSAKKGVDPGASTLVGPVEEDNMIPGFPTEIEARDRADKLLEIINDTSLSEEEILKELLDNNLIGYEGYFQAIKFLYDQDKEAHKQYVQEKLSEAQGYLQVASNLTQSLVNFNTAAMNKELKAAGNNEAKKEAIKKEYAKKNQDYAVLQARIAGAMAIMNIWAGTITGNPVIDTVLKALLTIAQIVLTESQVSEIKSATYGEGNYADIIGAMDGKRYRAKVSDSKHPSGLFSEPTYVPGFGLFGETKQPELVFNPVDTQKLINSPGLINAINATIGNGRQYASGNTREIIRENRSEMFTDPVMLKAINRLNDIIENGIEAKLRANEDYIDTHKKVINDHDTFLSKVNAG